MNRICVFCGSNEGDSEVYRGAAEELAGLLVRENIELVYGGAQVGLMGRIADAVLQRGGEDRGQDQDQQSRRGDPDQRIGAVLAGAGMGLCADRTTTRQRAPAQEGGRTQATRISR